MFKSKTKRFYKKPTDTILNYVILVPLKVFVHKEVHHLAIYEHKRLDKE